MAGKNDDGSMMGVRKADFGGLRHVPRLDSLNGAGTSVAPARKTSVMDSATPKRLSRGGDSRWTSARARLTSRR